MEDFDLGPDEHQLVLDEAELNSEQQRKIKQLQSEKLRLQAEVESLSRRVRVRMTFRTVFSPKIFQHPYRRILKSLRIFLHIRRIQFFLILTFFYAVGFFTGVCDSVHRGGWGPGPRPGGRVQSWGFRSKVYRGGGSGYRSRVGESGPRSGDQAQGQGLRSKVLGQGAS